MRKIIGLIALLGLSSCATQPWSIIEGDGANKADTDQHDVVIVAVNDQWYFDFPFKRKIEPGPNLILLRTTGSNRQNDATDVWHPINAEPCMRYVLFAQHVDGKRKDYWELGVERVEKISGCKLEISESVVSIEQSD